MHRGFRIWFLLALTETDPQDSISPNTLTARFRVQVGFFR